MARLRWTSPRALDRRLPWTAHLDDEEALHLEDLMAITTHTQIFAMKPATTVQGPVDHRQDQVARPFVETIEVTEIERDQEDPIGMALATIETEGDLTGMGQEDLIETETVQEGLIGMGIVAIEMAPEALKEKEVATKETGTDREALIGTVLVIGIVIVTVDAPKQV